MRRIDDLVSKARFILEQRGVREQNSTNVGRTRNGVMITGWDGLDGIEVLEIRVKGRDANEDALVLVPSAVYTSGDWEQRLDRWHNDIVAGRW